MVDNTMLNVNPAGVEALEVTDELLEPRWSLEGILRENSKNLLSLMLQAGLPYVAGILDGLLAEHDSPIC